MPKVRRSKKSPPEGWELIEPTLEELEQKMREAETEPHEGKRKVESLWPIFKIHHQKSRYIYDLFYRRKAISRELYEYCLNESIADKNLIAKWKKQGYENLCCLRCIQARDTNFGTSCICRVPKAKLEENHNCKMEMKFSRHNSVYVYLYIITAANLCDGHKDKAYMRNANDGFSTRYNWMSEVRDDVQLSEMAIPGTHNSAGYIKLQTATEIVSGFYTSITGIWKKNESLDSLDNLKNLITIDMQATQVLNIRQQLQYGIRVFDINLIYFKNQFGLIHREHSTFLNLLFDEFLNQLANFLVDNPKETVLFMLVMKEEVGENDKSPTTRLEEYLRDPRVSQFYLETKNNNVTLGEARGKFIIISKDVNFNEFGLVGTSEDFITMDKNHLSTNWDLYSKKWVPVKEHLKTATSGSKYVFYINFLSGYGGSFPYFVASGHSSPATSAPRLVTGLTTPGWKHTYPDFPRVSCFIGICSIVFEGINTLAKNTIQSYNKEISHHHRSVGIIMADFPGDSLIDSIIYNNALLKKKT